MLVLQQWLRLLRHALDTVAAADQRLIERIDVMTLLHDKVGKLAVSEAALEAQLVAETASLAQISTALGARDASRSTAVSVAP